MNNFISSFIIHCVIHCLRHFSTIVIQPREKVGCLKLVACPGWMHETSAQAWCTGKTQRDLVEREVGGGIRVGNTCKSMPDSCQCMTKTTTIL